MRIQRLASWMPWPNPGPNAQVLSLKNPYEPVTASYRVSRVYALLRKGFRVLSIA